MTHTGNGATIADADTAQETTPTAEAAPRRAGRPSNKERGMGTPAYLLKMEEKAQKQGISLEEYLSRKAQKKTAKITNAPVEVATPVVNEVAVAAAPESSKTDDTTTEEVVMMEEPITEEVHEVRVKHTNDYDIFNFKAANRKLVQATLRELRIKIPQKNMLHLKPILVDRKMNIIDGQHRYTVAKELGLTIYYIVGDVTDKEMLELNANQKSLVLTDYLDSFVAQGEPEYITVNDFIKTHKINLYAAISLLAGRKSQANAELVKTFKDGKFKVRDLEHAERVLSIRDKMAPFAPEIYQQRKFTNAVAQVISQPGFDEERLLSSFQKSGYGQINPAISSDLYTKQILGVYNYKRPRKNHLLLAQ